MKTRILYEIPRESCGRPRLPWHLGVAIFVGIVGADFPAEAADCVLPPAGLVAWWTGDGSAIDIAGTNHGTLIGGTGFSPGIVAQAFMFDGIDDYVKIPQSSSLNIGAGEGFTIEAWINPFSVSAQQPILEWGNESRLGVHLWISVPLDGGGIGSLYAACGDIDRDDHRISSAPGLIAAGCFQHVAFAYRKQDADAALFVNGVAVRSKTLGAFGLDTALDLTMGARIFAGIGTRFGGFIDELSVYDRVLSTNEIGAIYAAGNRGKRKLWITSQPQSQVGYWGKSATFSVGVNNYAPSWTYQWRKEGVPIPGATDASLVLTNLQTSDAGTYTVVVSDSLGTTVTSAPAYLTVNPAGVAIALYPGVTIDGVVGLTYGIQATTDLSNTSSWFGLTNLTLTTPVYLWYDSQPATAPQRYYRVVPGPISIP